MLRNALIESFQQYPALWLTVFGLVVLNNIPKSKTRRRRRLTMDLVTIASETIWISIIPTAMVAGIIALGAIIFIKLRNWIQDNFI